MRTAPLVLVGIALGLTAAGIWLLGSSTDSAVQPQAPGLLPAERAATGNSHSRAHSTPIDLDPLFDAPPTARVAPNQNQTGATSLAERSSPTPETGSLRVVGRVTAAGTNLPQVRVSALGNATELSSVMTASDGSFAIDLPGDATPPLALRFDAPGTYPLGLPLGRLTNQRTDLGRVQLDQGTPLDGKLIGSDGAPAPGAWLTATPANRYTIATAALVDGSGTFHLPISPSRGRIFAGARGHATLELSSRSLQAAARADPEQLARVELSSGHSFDFELLDAEGEPIPGAWVQLIPNSYGGRLPYTDLPFLEAEKCPSVLNARTDELGRVQLGELAPEPYFLRATCEGYLTEFGLRIDPFSGERYRLTLQKAPAAWISVLGFDPESGQSQPVEGLRVGLLAAEQRLWIELQPNADGTLRHFLPDSNPWTYEAWAPGFELQAGRVIPSATPSAPPQAVLLFPAEADPLRITAAGTDLLESAKLTGAMMSRARRAAAVPGADAWPMQTRPIAPGLFEVPRAGKNGSPTWEAEAPGLLTRTWGLLDWPRQTEAGSLELELQPAATLLVEVTTKSGEPVPGAKLYLSQAGKGSPVPWITDSEGRVQLTGLASGSFTIQARSPSGSLSRRTTVELRAGEKKSVELRL